MVKYTAPKVCNDLDPHYVWGALEASLRMIAEGTQTGTGQEWARKTLENLSDPENHITSIGGTA